MAYSLSGERPIAAAWPIRMLVVLLRQPARAVAALRRRQMLVTLLELDDHRLWDLGVTRYDILKALKSPDQDVNWARDRRRTMDVWPPR